jgi:adenylate cyclase
MMSRLAKGTFIGVAAGILGIVASGMPVGLYLEENFGLGILFHLRGHRTPPPDVVIVSIDKESADSLDQDPNVTNWPRSLHARLTETLASNGAAVIVFDVFFEEYSDLDGDLAFAEAMRKAKNVVLCKRLQAEKISLTDMRGKPAGRVKIAREIPPIPLLADASVAVSPYPLPKIPVKVSRNWVFRETIGDTHVPTMPVVAFQLYALPATDDLLSLLGKVFPARAENLPRSGEDWVRSTGAVKMIQEVREIFEKEPLAEKRMLDALDSPQQRPVDPKIHRILRSLIHLYGGGVSKFLNFYGPTRTIPTIPFYRALELRSTKSPGVPSPEEVAGKAVFVGSSESRQLSQKDGFYTVYTEENGVDLSGVEIAATEFANLIEDMPIRPLPFHYHAITLLAWALGVGILSFVFRPAFAIPGVAALSLLYLGAVEYRFATAGVWYPVVFPLAIQGPIALLGAVAWNYVDLQRQRKHFRRTFEQYLPAEVVDELAENVSGLNVSNRLTNGICLATDAGQYTSLSESLNPRELADIMNRYYETIFEPINRRGGMVSNVVGDSMLALWLSGRENTASMGDACGAAIEIAIALREFRQTLGKPALPTRIGLHAGEIFLGNIGSARHFEYRPVGDIVNTATRIEGMNKYLGTKILVSAEVCSAVNGFLTRNLGKFLLAGKTRPVNVHELISRVEDSTPRQRDCCDRFTAGVEAFRRQSWVEASRIFNETLTIHGGDGPSHFYLDLCARYSQSPPGESWDGVIHLRSK